MLEPVVARYRDTVKRLYFRGDAAFANPEIYKFLEAEGMGYAIRLPANSILQSKTDTCSSARLGDRRMSCAATSPASAIRRKAGRNRAGRGEGRVAPQCALPACRLHLHQSGAIGGASPSAISAARAEQCIKEAKGAIRWTRLWCGFFATNAMRLQLHALAYNLDNFMRTLAMPRAAES